MENWRLVLLVTCVVLSLLLIATKGFSYGIDFVGGTELKMRLGEGGEAVIDPVVDIFKNRLNGIGLKSTMVLKEADNRHIVVKVASVDPVQIQKVKDIINQQAVFEQLVEGQPCASGTEISLDISQQGGSFISGNRWQVYVKTTGEAPARCGQAMKGKAGHMTDVFLDRPDKAFILLDSSICSEMSKTEFKNHVEDAGYTQLSFIEDRALIPVVCYTSGELPEEFVNDSLLEELGLESEVNESLLEELGLGLEANESLLEELGLGNYSGADNQPLDLGETISEMERLYASGKTHVILMVNATDLSQELQNKITELNASVKVYGRAAHPNLHLNDGTDSNPDNTNSWIDVVTGIRSTLSISEGLTYGSPIYSSVFEGGGATAEQARATAEQFRVWLTSGNLPVKVDIVMERPNLPELGQQFFRYIGIMALIALGLVAAIISIRYRRPKISVFILTTSFSEIIIVLGFAALASWELDMAAFAGIIAAIGTGVDHQVVITDEALRGERKREEKQRIWNIQESLNRAFFIIITSVLTVIFAMFPLMSITDLRGFAFTTIIGALIGLMITRPAYARLIELFMERG